MAGQSVFPYEAASWATQEMGNWLPWIRSPDAEINQFRDRMVARHRDLVRNDGLAAGGITRILDNTVGASTAPVGQRLIIGRCKARTRCKFDSVWAEEYRRTVEALWRDFSDDIGRFNDVSRQLTVSQQMRLALRHKLVDGDSLVVNYWMPERVGCGGATYATALLVVDPDRLSNPYQMVDSKYLRGGVEIDDHGVPIAYHIRKAHQNDWYNSVESMDWERVCARMRTAGCVSSMTSSTIGLARTGVSASSPRCWRASRCWRGITGSNCRPRRSRQPSALTSPAHTIRRRWQDALSDESSSELTAYQQLRADWADERPAMLNGARIPTLAPVRKSMRSVLRIRMAALETSRTK